jgi:hypothetical protein
MYKLVFVNSTGSTYQPFQVCLIQVLFLCPFISQINFSPSPGIPNQGIACATCNEIFEVSPTKEF